MSITVGVILQKIVFVTVFAVFSYVKAKLFYQFKCRRATGIALLTVWSMLPDMLIETETLVTPVISVSNYMIFLAANLSVYLLTPLVLMLLVKDWLRTSANVYMYKMVFCSLPASMAYTMVMQKYILTYSADRVVLQETIAFTTVYSLFSVLSIIACQKRWLGKVPAALSVAIYVIGFYMVKLGTGLFNIYYAATEGAEILDISENDIDINLAVSLMSVVFLLLASVILVVFLLVGRRKKAQRLMRRNSFNERLSTYLKSGTEEMRRFRHDLANHIQAGEAAYVYGIGDYSRSLKEFAEGFISPELTGCKELDVFLEQIRSLLAASGKELRVEVPETLAELSPEKLSDTENTVLEKLCDIYFDGSDAPVVVSIDKDGSADCVLVEDDA